MQFEKCHFPKCDNVGTEVHHVTYLGFIVLLCKKYHQLITALNSHIMRKQHHKLSDKQRWFLWYQFINGKKIRISKLDKEYLEISDVK